jgi:uncharacterized protein YecE (DUF72 family)
VYPHWRGGFYPPGLPGKEALPFYAARFPTVEVNFSFYRLPERAVFASWRRETPPGFLFTVKASRYLTHMRKLKDPEEPLERLMDRARGLGRKLGPILFQFPHTWRCNVERLTGFLHVLGRYAGQRFAFEFRHSSWLVPPVYALLEQAGAALCLPVLPSLPLDVRVTADWTYVRMHGGRAGIGYEGVELRWWARRLRAFLDEGRDVYVYFNNDAEGYALRDAEHLRRLMGDRRVPAPPSDAPRRAPDAREELGPLEGNR